MDADFFLSCFEMQYLEQDYIMSKKRTNTPEGAPIRQFEKNVLI